MRHTRCKNRHIGAAAVAVAADAALAEASLELPPANNPANAAALADPSLGSVEVALDNIDCLVSLDAGSKEVASLEVPAGNNDAVFADAGLEVTAVDNNADAAADASLAGEVASVEAPPADNNADAANADAAALALEAPPDNNSDAAADASLAGEVASVEAPTADNNADAVADDSLACEVASMEDPPADYNADAAADASLAGEVASMEAPPADNNIDAANADAAAADASDVELEFDWQPVSIIEIV